MTETIPHKPFDIEKRKGPLRREVTLILSEKQLASRTAYKQLKHFPILSHLFDPLFIKKKKPNKPQKRTRIIQESSEKVALSLSAPLDGAQLFITRRKPTCLCFDADCKYKKRKTKSKRWMPLRAHALFPCGSLTVTWCPRTVV